tara:strand:- start:4388 stop:4657 length:270 start_codon:yes stop_codon:yes gene_type:complete
MEPYLKIKNNEYKPLSQCDKAETTQLQEQILDKLDLAIGLPNNNMFEQLARMLEMVEERLHLYDVGYLKEYGGKKKKIRKKISLLSDDD